MKVGINQAREICNVVRKNFPYESPWLQYNTEFHNILECKNIDQCASLFDLKNKIAKKQGKIQELRESYQFFSETPFKYFRELINAVHTFEVQNCGEFARITYAVLRMNGIKNKDIHIANLAAMKNKDYSKSLFPAVEKFFDLMHEIENGGKVRTLDHVATQVNCKNDDEIIIDALFNECETKGKMEKIYKTRYGDILNVSETEMVNVFACESFPNLKEDEVAELKRIYPELVIDKKDFQPSKKNIFSFLFK